MAVRIAVEHFQGVGELVEKREAERVQDLGPPERDEGDMLDRAVGARGGQVDVDERGRWAVGHAGSSWTTPSHVVGDSIHCR